MWKDQNYQILLLERQNYNKTLKDNLFISFFFLLWSKTQNIEFITLKHFNSGINYQNTVFNISLIFYLENWNSRSTEQQILFVLSSQILATNILLRVWLLKEGSCSICLCVISLFHLTQYSQGSSCCRIYRISFFVRLNNILLYVYTTFSLHIHLLIDT